ncbi:MAG TPA: FadR/GntR family transcriptional regulator [Burkholderiaceae bacterium]|nr:FadR/GntR family transcriptional regulator [Burkholderiaceae bacterium]
MPLQAVETRRLYRQIADQLRALIAAGEFPVGSRLPPERDLAAQLGVSRPSVREALIALEVEGLVEVRMGSGIYVTALEPTPAKRAAAADALGPFDIMRARQLIETELVALAAEASTPALVKRLRAALRSMEEDIAAGVMPLRGDREFHIALAEASGNAALVRVVGELFEERNNPLFEQLGRHFENIKSWRCAVDEHRAVVKAVAAGDTRAARRAMQTHLQLSQDRFAAALVEPAPPARAVAGPA